MGDYQRSPKPSDRDGFTLIEILIVLAIISILMAGLGVTISKMATQAKEAQTIATLRKIDGLIIERMQGLERAYDSRDFRKYVERIQDRLAKGDPANGIPQLFGVSAGAVETVARKDFFRDFFPQRFVEMADVRTKSPVPASGADGIPDRIQFDEVYGNLTWVTGPATALIPTGHTPVTESSELLYFALTRMDMFGVPSTGTDAFLTQEVADTDNDGLPEFVDGWGNPLRFYRWPTRLFKPAGLLGNDGAAGAATVDDDNTGTMDDVEDLGWPGTDDAVITARVREFAGIYIKGLPRAPIMFGGVPVAGDYDMLNEDPDDSYGELLTQVGILDSHALPQNSNVLRSVSESRYHTMNTFHKPLVVSAGADGFLGLYEPYHNEDVNANPALNLNGFLDPGEDANGNGRLDLGILAQPVEEIDSDGNGSLNGTEVDINGNGYLDNLLVPTAARDDLTNRNQRAGG